MRKNRENQLPLSPSWPDHRLARELESISKILDQNPSISDLVLHDLCDKVSSKNGARGMTAEQVLRCALIKQTHQFSYQKLAIERIADVTFHSGGIHSNLTPFLQTFLISPTDQHPIDGLPSGGFNPRDVLLQGGFAGGEPIGKPAENPKALRVGQVKSQLLIRELVGLFDQSTT